MTGNAALTVSQIEAIRSLEAMSRELQLQESLMLVGATALLLQLQERVVYKGRTTKDVDFTVRVQGWEQHHELMNLAGRSGFHTKGEHRLIHVATSTIIDLVPFGGNEKISGTIVWPHSEKEMTVLGLEEALVKSKEFEVAGGTKVRVADLPNLVVLKLFSWFDRSRDGKGKTDLEDVNFILTHCAELPEFEAMVYEKFARALDHFGDLDFTDHAGTVIVGSILQQHLGRQVTEKLRFILNPLLDDPYHPSIGELVRDVELDLEKREIICSRFSLLARYLSPERETTNGDRF